MRDFLYHFKADEDGNLVSFPFSFWGRGYVLEGEAQERILSGLTRSSTTGIVVLLAFSVLLIAAQLFFGLTRMQLVWLCLAPLPPLVVVGRIMGHRQVKGLRVSELRFTYLDFMLVELDRYRNMFLALLVLGAFVAALGVVALVIAGFQNDLSGSAATALIAMLAVGVGMSSLAWRARKALDRARREGRID